MEAFEDAKSGSSTGESPCPVIMKRKRSQRHRTLPQPAADASSASSGTTTTTDEEEDMANCLMLLARGRTSKAIEEAAATGGPAVYLYECKTCNKCFSSFQALGGHRASHKKPKMAAKEDSALTISASKLTSSLPSSGGKPRMHGCSICEAEFFSGQALGGHMRRHRPAVFPQISRQLNSEKSGFSLDLNLPAPADDDPCPPPPALLNCYY